MRQFLGGMMVVFLCCAAGAVAGEEPPEARLREAQAAFDEANTLQPATPQQAFHPSYAQVRHLHRIRADVCGPSPSGVDSGG